MPANALKSQISTHKNLIVYQKAKDNTLSLYNYYKNKRLSWIDQSFTNQLLRASASIGANITEGYGRNSKGDYKRFLIIAKGSALETEYWIDLLIEIDNKQSRQLEEIQGINTEIIKILTTLIKNIAN